MVTRNHTTGKMRQPDIVVYNRFSSAQAGVYPVTDVHVIEAKVRDNYDPTKWADQINEQTAILTSDGMARAPLLGARRPR